MIQFKAKSLKTGLWVKGDLATVDAITFGKRSIKYYIVSHHAQGGMLYIGARTQIDPETIIQDEDSVTQHKEMVKRP